MTQQLFFPLNYSAWESIIFQLNQELFLPMLILSVPWKEISGEVPFNKFIDQETMDMGQVSVVNLIPEKKF